MEVWNTSWASSNPKRWCCWSAALNMPANSGNSAVTAGLEKVSFHSNPKERQCQRIFKLLQNCTHLTCQQSIAQNSRKHLLLLHWLHQNLWLWQFVDHHKLWEILQEMGIPKHLTCLLRNLDKDQEATVRTRHGKTDCFQIRKGVHQGCILSPHYLTSMQSKSWEMPG